MYLGRVLTFFFEKSSHEMFCQMHHLGGKFLRNLVLSIDLLRMVSESSPDFREDFLETEE